MHFDKYPLQGFDPIFIINPILIESSSKFLHSISTCILSNTSGKMDKNISEPLFLYYK